MAEETMTDTSNLDRTSEELSKSFGPRTTIENNYSYEEPLHQDNALPVIPHEEQFSEEEEEEEFEAFEKEILEEEEEELQDEELEEEEGLDERGGAFSGRGGASGERGRGGRGRGRGRGRGVSEGRGRGVSEERGRGGRGRGGGGRGRGGRGNGQNNGQLTSISPLSLQQKSRAQVNKSWDDLYYTESIENIVKMFSRMSIDERRIVLDEQIVRLRKMVSRNQNLGRRLAMRKVVLENKIQVDQNNGRRRNNRRKMNRTNVAIQNLFLRNIKINSVIDALVESRDSLN